MASIPPPARAEKGGAQPPVGIDLGTTYSVVAYVDDAGRPVTVPNRAGDLLTPSAVLVDENELVIGKEAVKNSVLAPDRYADCFKRDMGGSCFRRRLCQWEVPAEVLSGFVLERLKTDAELRLGPLREVVITVPAFFDESRRKATQDAGRLAGLEVLDIINEPTAAAVAYGYQHGFLRPDRAEKPTRVLVYDLGGGTFDVTLLEIDQSRFRAIATDGDVQLGGKDFDQRLVEHLAGRFHEAHGVDPRSDPSDAAQLWIDAQEAKHSLSERAKTSVPLFHAGLRLRVELARAEFEDSTRDLLERTETTCSLVLKQAGMTWPEIDRVLLVGGATRMPMVARMLRALTGKEPDRSLSPDEVVAHGAALYAAMLRGRDAPPATPRCELVNINSHSLGVVGLDPKTRQPTNVVLIPKNSRLPCRAVRVGRTARDDQRSVNVRIVEGESQRPENCISLGTCTVRGLPTGLPRGTPIEVEYSYTANGRISVSARVPKTRQSAHVEIQRDYHGNAETLEVWRRRLCGQLNPLAAGAGPADSAERQKRLDQLYAVIGEAALGLPLPPALAQVQRQARAAAEEATRARARLKQADEGRNQAVTTADVIRAEAALAAARDALGQAQSQEDFAYLVLGRECCTAGSLPRGLEGELAEVRRLQAQSGS
jgi:molecular chaperone DnaK